MEHDTVGDTDAVSGMPGIAEADTPEISSPEDGQDTQQTGTPAAAPRRSPSRWAVAAWVAAAIVVIAIAAAGIVIHVDAHRSFDAAVAALQDAVADADIAEGGLHAALGAGGDAVDVADDVLALAGDDLVDVAARTTFAEAAAAASAAETDGQELLEAPVRVPATSKPFWTWELWNGQARLEAGAARLEARAAALATADVDAETAGATLAETAGALYASVPVVATALEAANVSARNDAVLDFRATVAAVAEQTELTPRAAEAFETYATQAANLKSSAQAELAEKAGPLLPTRLEIEAFARSIAGGVLLDFDWADVVNGRSGSEWMSGNARWEEDRGGYATITLSNTVAANWPEADARALVAHEVGHAITAKCSDMFDSDDSASNEAWATAWAISMGHVAEGNGVQAYGHPPQSLIDLAATCR